MVGFLVIGILDSGPSAGSTPHEDNIQLFAALIIVKLKLKIFSYNT